MRTRELFFVTQMFKLFLPACQHVHMGLYWTFILIRDPHRTDMEAIKFSWSSWQGKEILSQSKKALQQDSEVDKRGNPLL